MLPGKRAKMEAEPSTTRSTREAETSAATVEHAVNQEITLSLGDGRVDAVVSSTKYILNTLFDRCFSSTTRRPDISTP